MQLADRLGETAMKTVTTSAQLQGRVWSNLSGWHGDAEAPDLPAFAPGQVDLGPDVATTMGAIELTAVRRYPLPDNFPVTVTGWTQLGGPGTVILGDPAAASTTATFPGPGTYELAYALSQQDDRDPGNIVTYNGSDSLMVTIIAPPDATGVLVSTDSIVGEGQSSAPIPGYYPDDGSNNIGTSGSDPSNTRNDRNLVLGFSLPTLPAGQTIDSVNLLFEISGARDQTGAGNLPDLQVHLLDTTNPDASGTSLFYHGPGDPSPGLVLVDTTSVSISGTSQNSFTDDAEDRTFALMGAALALFQSFYGGDHVPDQAEAFFRFNLSADPALGDLRRYNIDLATDESRLDITTGAGTFADWISNPAFKLDPADQDFPDDPDGDRVPNGLEAWFGTHPGEFNPGLADLATDGTTTTFDHPQNVTPPRDLSVVYQWSPNLVDWYAGDGTDGTGGGPTVTMVPATVGSTTTVTATASEPLDLLFLRVGVMQNP
jgi:hypothetical protein